MRHVAVITALLICGAMSAIKIVQRAHAVIGTPSTISTRVPDGVRLFDLHDPGLANSWSGFLATTPMQNDQLLPLSLQSRLASLVGTYRSLTPVGEPAYFVATYFDMLAEGLLSENSQFESRVLPMQICPVFVSGKDAPVSKILAAASGLSSELFVNAPGQRDRYRYLLLQTEFSHCQFLTTASAINGEYLRAKPGEYSMRHAPNISFRVGPRNFRVHVGSRDELRAIVETVGEIDAISAFRKQWPANGIADEADVLRYVRLLSLLATDSKNGYGAIPILFPLLNSTGEYPDPSGSLEVSDALELAYRLRAVFRENVPIDIRDTDDLLRAKQSVMQAQADNVAFGPADAQIHGLLRQFVVGSDLLLPARAGKENSAAY